MGVNDKLAAAFHPAPTPTRAALHECESCHRTYDSEISLLWCCNLDEERRRGIFRGSD